MSFPSKKICPPVGVSSRLMQRSIVLLPEPEEPMMLMTSPFSTEKLMSRSTACVPNCFSRWDSLKISAMSHASFRMRISACESEPEPQMV